MAKIDIDRFICSLFKERIELLSIIKNAIKDQGLTYKDGEIVEINPKPKFKVGDWCIDNEDGTIFQIVKVLDNTYTYKTNKGKEYSCSHYSLENDARLWTVQDAKDGDVLVSSFNQPFLFKEVVCDEFGKVCCAYGGIDGSKKFISNTHEKTFWTESEGVNIATKEQRDLLFQKMKEAGYYWMESTKELVSIKPLMEPTKEDVEEFNEQCGFTKKGYRKDGLKKEQKEDLKYDPYSLPVGDASNLTRFDESRYILYTKKDVEECAKMPEGYIENLRELCKNILKVTEKKEEKQ